MLHFFKFRQELFDPQPAKDVYVKRKPSRGWPEQCPPIRAANAFGFDLAANFDVTFVRDRNGSWSVRRDVVLESDFDYVPPGGQSGVPLSQRYAWFWEKGRRLPHEISPNVYREIRNQVKISSYLFLRTDPNELLYMTDVPNWKRSWRCLTALIETDWYPAGYPWHAVIELDPSRKSVTIRKGEPLCRVMPVRRDSYFAAQMTSTEFDAFFARGQRWLAEHGRAEHEGDMDITGTYVRQQLKSKFTVIR